MLALALLLSKPVFQPIARMIWPPLTPAQLDAVARQLPPSSRMAKRYTAMATALRNGQRSYSFSADTASIPQLAPSPNQEAK